MYIYCIIYQYILSNTNCLCWNIFIPPCGLSRPVLLTDSYLSVRECTMEENKAPPSYENSGYNPGRSPLSLWQHQPTIIIVPSQVDLTMDSMGWILHHLSTGRILHHLSTVGILLHLSTVWVLRHLNMEWAPRHHNTGQIWAPLWSLLLSLEKFQWWQSAGTAKPMWSLN